MAGGDTKLSGLGVITSVAYSDIAYIYHGTPPGNNCTAQNFVKGGASQGAVSALIDANLTASKNLVSDASGKVTTTDDTWGRWRGSGSTAPTSPQEGDIWNDTTSGNTIKIYANGDWRTT